MNFPAFLAVFTSIALLASVPLEAQGNDDDFTPLNSRIRRDRQFPTEPRATFSSRELGEASRLRSRNMVDQFARCIWDRSNEKGLDLLARTDVGFASFEQIGLTYAQVIDRYPIQTCLSRVADANSSGVNLRYDAPSMRRWYLQAAYLKTYEDGPSWIRPGYVVGPREFPISTMQPQIHDVMNLADCIVAADPQTADYFFRTGAGSPQETEALRQLVPAISACVPDGREMEIEPFAMRIWLGEGLWHAARNSAPAPAAAPEEAQ